MPLVTFELATPLGPLTRTGALVGGDHVVDLCLARAAYHAARGRPRYRALAEAEVPSDMLELLQGGEYAMEAAREAVDHATAGGDATVDGAPVCHALDEVRILAPLPRPNSLRDFLVFEEHMATSRRSTAPTMSCHTPATPRSSTTNLRSALSSEGPDGGSRRPTASPTSPATRCTTTGRRETSRCARAASASARASGRTSRPRSGRASLPLTSSASRIIEYISQEATIVPGDLLGSGTIGLGCGFEVDRYLSPGMTVELEAEGIGLLRNSIGDKGPRSSIGAPATLGR